MAQHLLSRLRTTERQMSFSDSDGPLGRLLGYSQTSIRQFFSCWGYVEHGLVFKLTDYCSAEPVGVHLKSRRMG